MEWCNGGSLKKAITSMNDDTLYRGLVDILKTLVKIRSMYPEFRHNDLHLDNVFIINGIYFKIGDFGWARIQKTGTNPAVNNANGTSIATVYGIGPKTDPRYDHHLLLNEVREIIKSRSGRFPKTMDLVDRAIPPGYRGAKDRHVSEWRLKYGDPCPGLPDIPDLIKEPAIYPRYIPLFTSANVIEAKKKLKKPRPHRRKLVFSSVNLAEAREKLRAVTTRRRVPFTSENLSEARGRLRVTRPVRRVPFTSENLTEARGRLKKRIRIVVPRNPAPLVRKNAKTGRIQIFGKKGRWVYTDGATVKVQNLKNMAARYGVSIVGAKTKANIAQKILNCTGRVSVHVDNGRERDYTRFKGTFDCFWNQDVSVVCQAGEILDRERYSLCFC